MELTNPIHVAVVGENVFILPHKKRLHFFYGIRNNCHPDRT